MSEFSAVNPNSAKLDPGKRVNYVTGQVLGVDDFRQEQFYLLSKDRGHNQGKHGYGTCCGLQVTVESTGDGQEIRVSRGTALDNVGRVICIDETQCALLDRWLDRDDVVAEIQQRAGGSPAMLSAYVSVCYRECGTDLIPIPAGPCQSLDDSSAPSRIADSFELHLSFERPEQREEEIVRRFGDLLSMVIPVSTGTTLTLDEFLTMVRALPDDGSPIPWFTLPADSPPSSPAVDGLPVHPDDLALFLDEALRVWVMCGPDIRLVACQGVFSKVLRTFSSGTMRRYLQSFL